MVSCGSVETGCKPESGLMASRINDHLRSVRPPQVHTDNKAPKRCNGAHMDYQVELVARAFFEAEHEDCSWDGEAERTREEFREYARNAIHLLHEDIGVLIMALQRASAEEHPERSRAAA